MPILTVCARKGGSAKTSTVATLAALWASSGLRVLAVDADPQSSLTRWIAADVDTPTLFDVIVNGAKVGDAVRPTIAERVSILAASRELATLDAALAGKVGNERRLAKALGKVDADVVIVDTAPGLSLGLVMSLVAADHALVVCEPSPMGIQGVADALGLIADATEATDGKLELAGILACRVQSRRGLTAEVLAHLRTTYGARVMRSTVREAAAVAECPSHRRMLTEYAASSPVLDDYVKAAREVAKRIGIRD